jgi:predicted N-acetyltransferase YhbS
MTESYAIAPLTNTDVEAAAKLLIKHDLATGKHLSTRLDRLLACNEAVCFGAKVDAELVGVLLSISNGFHVFLSHIAVERGWQRKGIGTALVDAVKSAAKKRKARGIIVDSRITTAGYFFKRAFRLPGAVFMIHDVE